MPCVSLTCTSRRPVVAHVNDISHPQVINKSGHGTAVDWWGLGMLMYEMLTGLPPWYTKDRQKLFERLRGAPLIIPKNISAPSASIIAELLARNPSKRLGNRGALEVRAASGVINFVSKRTHTRVMIFPFCS